MGKISDTQKNNEAQRLARIESLVRDFCGAHLGDEYETYCLKLFGTLARKRKINIRRGKEEIWAASIIYVIARLNFLFDKDNEDSITADIVCNFFGAKKSTIGTKATQIEKACNLSIGQEGYCTKEITDSFTFYQSPEGFIFPKSALQETEIVLEIADEKESEEIRRAIQEQEELKAQKLIEKKRKRTEINRKIAEDKKKKKEKEIESRFGKQLSLFGDS